APNTYAALQRLAEKHPARTALTFFLQGTKYEKHVSYTFRDVFQRVTQTANMLHDLGVRPTDTVAYILPNLPQTYFTLFGGEAAGIVAPINPLLEPPALADILRAAEAKVLVTMGPFPRTDVWPKVAAIADDVPTLETILRVDLANYLGGVMKLLVGLMRRGQGKERLRARVLDFDATAARYPTDRLVSGRVIGPDEVAAYFHTGGTTGTPKLAVQTHFNQVYDSWAATLSIGVEEGDSNFLGLPLFHNYGALAVGLGTWQQSASIVMGTPQGFRGEGVIENFWRIMAHYRCNLFSGVPTLFKALLNVPVAGVDISHVRGASSGAAPLPVEIARQFIEHSGVKIVEGYGLTEGTSVASVNPIEGEIRLGSVGFRLPYEEMRIAIIEDDALVRFCEPGETGVVVLRGPNVFKGYRDPFYNQGVFVDAGDGGGPWLNTGDRGYQDEDGYFWLTGREKELIIRGGHNIDPRLIEEPMHEHPAVALAASVGRPDPRVGEVPVVYVELKPDATATEEELMAFAQEHIGERAAIPKRIYIIDQIPLTAVGKVFKPALFQQQVVEVFGQEVQALEGVTEVLVGAEGDKRLGTVARVQVKAAPGVDKAALEQQVRQVLGQYAVHFDVVVE
ncbi:MAG: acyl-CoA synthetase, partial [Caldilineae bacterium]